MNFNLNDNKTLAAIMMAIFGSNLVMCITTLLIVKPFKKTVDLCNGYLEKQIDKMEDDWEFEKQNRDN